MFSGSALEEAETGGRGLLGLLEDDGGGWCMPTSPGESTKGEFSDVKTSETSGETAEPCEFRDRKHPGRGRAECQAGPSLPPSVNAAPPPRSG